MSTPSTLPVQHVPSSRYGLLHHPSYLAGSAPQSPAISDGGGGTGVGPPAASSLRYPTTLINIKPRDYAHHQLRSNPASSASRPSSSSSQHPKPLPSPTDAATPTPVSNHSPSTNMSRARGPRQPDWQEFYKNGIPKEIIVIDDDEDTSAPSTARSGPIAESNGSSYPDIHSKKRRRTGLAANGDGQPPPVYGEVPHTPSYAYSHNGTLPSTSSTERTASMHTTAPTSLGSHGSGGSGSYLETKPSGATSTLTTGPAMGASTAAGQKRKRVTRQAAASEKKRQESTVERVNYNTYIPPAKPPIKATEVRVRVVQDNTHLSQRIDDDDGHFIVVDEADLGDRYKVCRLLGQGTFGKVVEAYDTRSQTRCAIKIIRSVPKYREASKIELRVLSTLAQNDARNRNKCIHLRDCFDWRNHICIVTDLLGHSVFDFLKANNFVPFPSSQIQNFARQLLTSVAFLHDLNLIHTDLKPENILLVSNSYQTFTYSKTIPTSSTVNQRSARQRRVLLDTDIRLIDFGSATFNDEYHSSVVSTRHYRAPEIILDLGWSYPCDIWSIGCILVEFFTGDALFQTHDNLEHLAMMEAVCGGKIDSKLIRGLASHGRRGAANPAAKFFKGMRLDYPNKDTSKASKAYVRAMKALPNIIQPITPFNRQFLDLLRRIFVYEPSRRITAHQALQHPWFHETIVDDGTEATRIRHERDAHRMAAVVAQKQQQQQQQQTQQQATNGYR